MRIELVSTGNELLSGKTVNTHAHTISSVLAELNASLSMDTTVNDDYVDMEQCIRSAIDRADMVFCTGGLGPTEDDITRDVVGKIVGSSLMHHEGSLAQIEAFCLAGGRSFNEARKRQALVLRDAEVFLNPVGAAPGQYIKYGDKHLFLLPGPPNEVKALLDASVRPKLEQLLPKSNFAMKIFQVALPEGDLVNIFREAELAHPDLTVAYCTSPYGVEVRLSTTNNADLLAASVLKAKEALGDAYFTDGRIPMEAVVGKHLAQAGYTISTAESCTGGLLGDRITDIPGSSAYYNGGIICYSNDVKINELGVSERDIETFGAVSEQVVRQMAEGVRRKFNSDVGVGISGIAGPTGGTSAKPAGLVFMAVCDPAGLQTTWQVFHTERRLVKQLATNYALNMVRLRLIRQGV